MAEEMLPPGRQGVGSAQKVYTVAADGPSTHRQGHGIFISVLKSYVDLKVLLQVFI